MVSSGTTVTVGMGVITGASVAVGVGVSATVAVGVDVSAGVAVEIGVTVGVFSGIGVIVGVIAKAKDKDEGELLLLTFRDPFKAKVAVLVMSVPSAKSFLTVTWKRIN